MTFLKSIISIQISLVFLFLNSNNEIEIQNINPIKKNNCGIESVTLKTERIEKKRKFLFWTLGHKKVIVTDRVIDQNGNMIFEKKSVFICSMDACDDRKFRRIKIKENEIWIFSHGRNLDKINPVKRYNFCGNFLGTKKWEKGDYYEL